MVKNGSSTQLRWGSWQIGGPRHYYRETLIMKLIGGIPPNRRILDVGCGTGSLMMQLVLRGYQVYGIDMSEDSVKRTNEHLRLLVPKNEFVVKKGSAEQINYPDGYFDAVIAAEVLEHLEKDYLAVREFYRLLKPNGICIITVPTNMYLWDISDEMAGHKRRYSKDDLLMLFNSLSFKVEKLLYYGFPLMRLYHRLVFLRWAKRLDKKMIGTVSSNDTITRIGLSWLATLILGNLFRIDNIFSSLPWGNGVLLIARKI